ncbi:MAG: hypothetical protein ACXVRS_06600 [Gaiellaceae bacterium]
MREMFALGVIALSALAAGGCGGSKPPSVLGAGFTARATALCQQALKEKRDEAKFPFASFNPTNPTVSELPAIGLYEKRGVEIFRSWDQKMVGLGSPPRGTRQWDALLNALGDHMRIIADQQAAAARRDAAEFTHDYYSGNAAQHAMAIAAKAASVSICAKAAAA